MNNRSSNPTVNPNLERSPEPFPKVTTIPEGWDLSELLDATPAAAPRLDASSPTDQESMTA